MIPVWILAAAAGLLLYTYAGYPALLWLLSKVRARPIPAPTEDTEWPTVSISVPAYNEEDQIEELIRSLLAVD